MSKYNPAALLLGLVLIAATACSDQSTPTDATSTDTTTGVTYSISVDSATTADSVDAEVGSTIPVRVAVMRDGEPFADGSVTWSVDGGNGTLSSSTSTTDSLGIASIEWTVGDTVGTNTLTAAVGGVYVTMTAIGIAGPATALTRITSDSVWLVGGASTLLTANTRDRFGNTVSGARIVWSTTTGTLARTESTSGTFGNAEVAFTAPLAAGVSTVTATLEGKASIRFRVIAVSGANE